MWGQNIICICRNKIGVTSLHRPAEEVSLIYVCVFFGEIMLLSIYLWCIIFQDGQQRASLQHVYTADGESKNISALSAITILPFSRLFLLGTDDGYLKICC